MLRSLIAFIVSWFILPVVLVKCQANVTAVDPAMKTFKFEVCEGLTNQKISLVHGLLVAYVTQRAVVLPELETSYSSSVSHKVPLSHIYDVSFLIKRLRKDIKFIHINDYKPQEVTKLENKKVTHGIDYWKDVDAVDLQIDCAFNIIRSRQLNKATWKIMNSLRFNKDILEKSSKIAGAIGNNGYTALHFRIEDDWVEHCKIWESIGGKVIRDNCMTYTDVIENVFAIQRVPTDRPLYVAGAYTEEFIKSSPLFARLLLKYNIVTKELLFDENELKEKMLHNREYFGAIDYVLCSQAELFIGNSVSTFSALIELERLSKGKPVFHYNAGDIPLTVVIPMPEYASKQLIIREQNRPLKWIFALVLVSKDKMSFVDMAKVAVVSAIENTSLDPVCLLHIAEKVAGESWVLDTVQWMINAGVTVIQHTPKYADKIKRAFEIGKKLGLKKYTPLYNDYYSMLGTFLRIDIPILGFIDKYVLYSDVDILFIKDLSLSDFPTLPKYLMMGGEGYEHLGYGNAGVTLFNVEGMRRTYKYFTDIAFSEQWVKKGLHYGKEAPGPLDQGALNLIYRGEYNKTVVEPNVFNWRPYWPVRPEYNSAIIHFHGPKPSDYRLHSVKPSKSLKLFKPLFKQCERESVDCKLWVDKYFDILNKVQGGYCPKYVPN